MIKVYTASQIHHARARVLFHNYKPFNFLKYIGSTVKFILGNGEGILVNMFL